LKINFFNKGKQDLVSGGYIYNNYLINHLNSQGHEVIYTDDFSLYGKADIQIIDSLLISEMNNAIDFIKTGTIGLLHVIPEALNSDFLKKVPMIVTGDEGFKILTERYKKEKININLIKPGISLENYYMLQITFLEKDTINCWTLSKK